MTRSASTRLLLAMVLTLAGVGTGAATLVESAAAAGGACPQGTGVTVVVDFGPLGGGVQSGCDPDGAGEKASTVVPAAGFSLTYVNGQAFVCRIDGLPDASQESCQRTPPTDAYWGLFWSDGTSGKWTYSTQGVGSLEVEEGGSIGWRFQDGGDREDPGMAPPAGDAPEPSASATPKPSSAPATPRPGSSAPAGTPTAAPGTTAGAEESASPAASGREKGGDEKRRKDDAAKADRATSREQAPSEPSETTSAAVDVATEPAASDSDDASGGGGALALVAAAAVAVLGATAVALGRRRRS